MGSSIEETIRAILREELATLKFHRGPTPAEDRLLTAGQAAALLNVSERWLYKHASKLPYAVRLSENVVRFSQNKIQARDPAQA
jgi:predicted DNA-binding transcriptional regulator AlpA